MVYTNVSCLIALAKLSKAVPYVLDYIFQKLMLLFYFSESRIEFTLKEGSHIDHSIWNKEAIVNLSALEKCVNRVIDRLTLVNLPLSTGIVNHNVKVEVWGNEWIAMLSQKKCVIIKELLQHKTMNWIIKIQIRIVDLFYSFGNTDHHYKKCEIVITEVTPSMFAQNLFVT